MNKIAIFGQTSKNDHLFTIFGEKTSFFENFEMEFFEKNAFNTST
jgi:hypothetical protein